jgi:hypothetical protein
MKYIVLTIFTYLLVIMAARSIGIMIINAVYPGAITY